MLEKVKNLIKTELKPIRHLVITLNGMELWSEKNKKPIEESYKQSFDILKDLVEQQIKYNIPILTIYLLPEELKKDEHFPSFLDSFVNYFEFLKLSELVKKYKIKISALGKWYDIPSRGVESIKSAIEETKDYDTFFINFCINYNGQEEIVDACKLIARQIKAEKLDIDAITKETIKDNIYSSYFMPPSLIIKNGMKKKTAGILLWDSLNTRIHFTQKLFPDFTKSDFSKAVEEYQKS